LSQKSHPYYQGKWALSPKSNPYYQVNRLSPKSKENGHLQVRNQRFNF
jgi:hypothetical protein